MTRKKPYLFTFLPVALMLLALSWLTVSLPFVFEAQKQLAAVHNNGSQPGDSEDMTCGSFGNTTEEKVETGSNTLSEYLHHTEVLFQETEIALSHNQCHDVSVYVAFHGELISPPPDFSAAA